jgi:outer membrane protein
MSIRTFIFAFISTLPAIAVAQDPLSADEAVSIALKNNYGILVAHNDAEIARLNNTAGAAGMLPVVGIAAGESWNSKSNSFTAAAVADWTIFDGGKMFVTRKKLGEIERLGAVVYKDRVLQTVYSVTVAYFDLVRQKQQLASINEVLSYNQERATIAKTSFTAGLSPKTTLLQAQVDLNVYKENAVFQKSSIDDAKRNFNRLLGRDPTSAFETADSIPIGPSPDKNRLLAALDSSNTTLASMQRLVEVARLTVAENRKLFWPKIDVNGGLGFVQSSAPSQSRDLGPQAGATVTIPIYQAGNAARQVETAKLQLESAKLNLEDTKKQVRTLLENALADFESQEQLLQIEKENNLLAKENMDISMQRLRLGQSTSLELRQAEESYEDSRTRLLTIQFNLKVAETKLKQLVAEL